MIAFRTLIETLTKFTLITHAINGEAFFGSAKSCFALMKRHFVGAVVTDQVGTSVLRLGAYVVKNRIESGLGSEVHEC